jgi:hypothetical protein
LAHAFARAFRLTHHEREEHTPPAHNWIIRLAAAHQAGQLETRSPCDDADALGINPLGISASSYSPDISIRAMACCASPPVIPSNA